MKKNISILILIVISLFSVKCANEDFQIDVPTEMEILTNTSTKLIVEYKVSGEVFNFESNFENGIVKSIFRIKTDEDQSVEINHLLDTNIPAFKLMAHQAVIDESTIFKEKMDKTDIFYETIILKFEPFARKILAIKTIDPYSYLTQAIFFHNAVIRTANRSFDNNLACECTPHPGYFVGKTPFWCQEDYVVDTERFANAIIESNYHLNPKEKDLFDFLNDKRKKERFVTIDKLFAITEGKRQFLSRVESQFRKANQPLLYSAMEEDCSSGSGSGLGCCGNYEGCCWYWSIYCLEHDLVCLKCDRWHCGPACTPST